MKNILPNPKKCGSPPPPALSVVLGAKLGKRDGSALGKLLGGIDGNELGDMLGMEELDGTKLGKIVGSTLGDELPEKEKADWMTSK